MLDKPGRLPITSPDENFMPGFDSDDYAPPEFRLVQPTSKAHTESGAALGFYHCESSGETTETLSFSILQVRRTLTLWGQDMAFPECASDDRIMPRSGGAYPGPCGSCPARNKDCFPGYNLLCVRAGTLGDPEPEMFLLRVGGTSVFPWRKLWPKIKTRYNNQPWRTLINLSSELKSNQKGTYHVMVPGEPSDLPIEEARRVQMLAQAMTGLEPKALEEPVWQAPQPLPTIDPAHPAGEGDRARLSVAPPIPATIDRERATSIVQLAEDLGVPPDIVTGFINVTFKRHRLSQLVLDEATTLEAWLRDEFGQTEKTAPDPMEDLPF